MKKSILSKSATAFKFGAALAGLCITACGDDSSSASQSSQDSYEYTRGNALETAVFQYAAESLGENSDSTISVPFYHVLGIDSADKKDIRVWTYIWDIDYVLRGDTLDTEFASEQSGVFHLKKNGNTYSVLSFDSLVFEAKHDPAEKLFGKYYKDYRAYKYNDFEQAPERTAIVADFVKKNDIPATMYCDYGYDPIQIFPDKKEPAKHTKSEIVAIYSAPQVQDTYSNTDNNTTIIYFYEDNTYRQYILQNGEILPYTEGSIQSDEPVDFMKNEPVMINVDGYYKDGKELTDVRVSFYVDLEDKEAYRLYPIKANKDKEVVAAFMQADKQKLVKADSSVEMLTTMWFYYEDGTFEQYALIDNEQNVLFSSGDYSIKGNFSTKNSVLTIHRTKKYKDGKGLSDYESEHDYEIGALEFIKVYPEK
ncbi:hypothetical protein [uncultured Fibrobacter sp.]|uniref:hypothetical protein n=1 Tax=uncultured Fibrobacter sp. TaxID=261512 RepID=UPI0026331C49|nr:hypothetical protein [uncultured Fibrobacter sp.]